MQRPPPEEGIRALETATQQLNLRACSAPVGVPPTSNEHIKLRSISSVEVYCGVDNAAAGSAPGPTAAEGAGPAAGPSGPFQQHTSGRAPVTEQPLPGAQHAAAQGAQTPSQQQAAASGTSPDMMLPGQFGQQAAHGQPDGPFGQQAAQGQSHGPFGQQAVQGQSHGPFGQQVALGQSHGPFGQQAVHGQSHGPFGQQAVQGQPDGPFGQQAAQGQPDGPFGQQTAQGAPGFGLTHIPFPKQVAAPPLVPSLEAEFAEDHAAFGAVLLPVGINTCTLGPEGDCQELDLLGQGSFGQVHLGLYYGDEVAVKRLMTQFGETQQQVTARILREVQLQARAAHHSGFVRFVAVCFDPPAIVMECCECSLEDRIHNTWAAQQQQQPQHGQQQQQQYALQQQPLLQQQPSWPLVVQLMKQAAGALAYLHRAGQAIFHNDVRAANMVLKHEFDRATGAVVLKLKICDFGLAVEAGAAQTAATREITHPSWQAPELGPSWNALTQMYTVSAATDVFALGCVLHEMMVVGVPQHVFPQPQHRLPHLRGPEPPGLQELFQACVGAAPRPPAQQVLMALSRMQAG